MAPTATPAAADHPVARRRPARTTLPSVEELVRVLDVAGEVRRRQEATRPALWTARRLARDELRETLVETARLAGEPLDEDGADAAVDVVLRPAAPLPPAAGRACGPRLWRVYVDRRRWLIAAAAVLDAIAGRGVVVAEARVGAVGGRCGGTNRLNSAGDCGRPSARGPRRAGGWTSDSLVRRRGVGTPEAENRRRRCKRLAQSSRGRSPINWRPPYEVRVLKLWTKRSIGGQFLDHPRNGGPRGRSLVEAAYGTGRAAPSSVDVADARRPAWR